MSSVHTEPEFPAQLLVEQRGQIGWIIFNDPQKHNAISFEMWEAIPKAITHFVENGEVRAIVFSGAGDRAFVSGANIGQFEDARSGRAAVQAYDLATGRALDAVFECAKPTIAKIRGYCIGGGVALAACCDIRIASDNSVFSIPAARLGLGYRLSAMRDLVAIIGQAHTLDMFLSARKFDANRAERINLIQHLVSAESLDGFVDRYAKDVATNAPLTIRTTKAMIKALRSLHAGIDQNALGELVKQCFDSDDYHEGKRAFAEKRQPKFSGR